MKNKILVADYYFLDKNKYDLDKLLSVFPMNKSKYSYRASLENLKNRSKLQSEFYNKLYPIFQKKSNKHLGYQNDEYRIVFNQIIIRLSNIFFDHLIRLTHILKNSDFKFNVQEVEEIDLSSSHSILSNFSSSWQLNQMMIMKISNIFEIQNVMYISKNDFPELNSKLKVKNLIFAPYGSIITNIYRRLTTIYIIVSKFLGRIINKKNKILSAGFSSDEFYFAKKGAYGPFGFMIRINNSKPKIIIKEKDTSKRKKFKTEIYQDCNDIFKIFINKLELNINSKKIDELCNLWINLIVNSIPVFLFEEINNNISIYKTYLKKNYFKKYLIGEPSTLIDNDNGILLSLACKRMRGVLLGIQHSAGHFGYIDDLSYGNFFEYSHYDKFFTFGWNKTNNYLPDSRFFPMPSPKLSSKNLKSNYLADITKSKKTVLFLSNTISRFPMGGTSGHSRIDFVDSILENQTTLIKDLTMNDISVIHKAYNQNVIKLFNDHFLKLKLNDNYFLEDINQKGLTKKLIKKSKILLWDQIGSGTVEAFACEIPSIIFWKRIYSQESDWARIQIKNLENVGIIHTKTKTLVNEIKKFQKNPLNWMNNEKRKKAILDFNNNYANYNENWYKIWKKQIKSLVLHD